MASEQNIEERVAFLENRVTELERQRAVQEDRDIALLARVDNFIDDLRRVERVQMRGFDELRVGQNELREELRAHQEYTTARFDGVEARLDNVETDVTVLIEAAKEHKAAIEDIHTQVQSLAAGQQQILEILMGGQRRND